MLARTKFRRSVTAVFVAIGVVGTGLAWQLTAAEPAPPTSPDSPPPPKTAPAEPPKGKEKADNKEKDADRIKPGDLLHLRAIQVFEADPIDRVYAVEPSGKIALGPSYGGRVKIDGLTLEEAEVVLTSQLRKYAKLAEVTVTRPLPAAGALEARVRLLEREVQELRAAVEELRKKKPQ